MALSRATGPAKAKEAVRMARNAKVKGAMRDRCVKKLSTTRPFEGYYCKIRSSRLKEGL